MFLSPLASLSFLVLGSSFFMSFISLYLKDLNIPEFQIGLIQSSFYLGLLFSSLLAEKLISRVGHIRSLTATGGMLGASTLILFIMPLNYWFVFRLIAGACVGCFYVGVESWLLVESHPAKRGFALSLYTMSLYLAQSLSQLLLSSVDKAPESAFACSALFTCLAVIPISLSTKLGPEVSVSEPHSILHFLKMSPLGVTGCFIAGLLLSTLYSYMPLYFDQKSFEPGLLMAILIFGGALLQWPIGKMSDRFDRRKVLVCLSFIGACLSLLIPLFDSVLLFGCLTFVLGGFVFTIYPVSMALGCDCVEHKEIVKMTGVLLFSYALGAVFGPLVTPALSGFGENYIAFSITLYCLMLLLIGTYALNTKEKIELEDQFSFSPIPTGPIVESLHPTKFESTEKEKLSSLSDEIKSFKTPTALEL